MNTDIGRLDAVTVESIDLPGLRIALRRPRNSEELLDEKAFELEEFLPYWADLWPSARALAVELAVTQLTGASVLELGCGLALPSIAAGLRGADVVATDWSAEALAFAAVNAQLNGTPLETALCRWDDPGEVVDRSPWDMIVAADVLYEQRNVDELLALLPRLVARHSEVLITDPDRIPAERFLREAADRWEIESRSTEQARVRLHVLRPRWMG
jgi:predicted nicotinamide N-methyase